MGIVESLAKTKGIAFRAEVPPGLPVGHGDDKRLTQVLLNLVGNAIKFTDHGEVRVAVAQVDKTFHVSVHDTGPGIAPDVAAHLFQPFFTTRAAAGGSGLGLWLSRAIVEEEGGTLAFRNRPEGGAVFTVELPRSQVRGPRSAAANG